MQQRIPLNQIPFKNITNVIDLLMTEKVSKEKIVTYLTNSNLNYHTRKGDGEGMDRKHLANKIYWLYCKDLGLEKPFYYSL